MVALFWPLKAYFDASSILEDPEVWYMKTIKNVHWGLYESPDKYGVLRVGVSWKKKRSKNEIYIGK